MVETHRRQSSFFLLALGLLVATASGCLSDPEFQPSDASEADAGSDTAEAGCTPTNSGTETCDGADNDCDGDVDEMSARDASEYFADEDGDGSGDPEASIIACEAPEDHVENDEDCNDENGEVNPDRTEKCDGIDNDCDGEVDESDAADASTWYEDGDGDGFGNPDVSRKACDAPNGFVQDKTDCDDTNPDVNPDAAEACNGIDNNCDGTRDNPADGSCDCKNAMTQPCGTNVGVCSTGTQTCNNGNWGKCMGNKAGSTETCDGKDNDCDGKTDEGKPSNAPTWYRDFDGDGFGNPSKSVVACDNPDPSAYVAKGKDCDDNNPDVHPGATEKCNGVDNDCSGTADDPSGRTCTCKLGATMSCGTDVGVCQKGQRTCIKDGSGGTKWSSCSAKKPNREVCDGRDNDCDGVTDENEFETVYGGDGNTFCARITTGSNASETVCWGGNADGELGDGTSQDRPAPVSITSNTSRNYTNLDHGKFHSCAATGSDEVYCWGFNASGQLGNGTTKASTTPVKVDFDLPQRTSISGMGGVAAGGDFACASPLLYSKCILQPCGPNLPEGAVLCWGNNSRGQLGNSSSGGNETKAVFVKDSTGFSAPTAGSNFACALDGSFANGKAWCWGDNLQGQLGNGQSGGFSSKPVKALGGHTFGQLTANGTTVCGLDTNGQAWCWGNGRDGQIGDGAKKNRNAPTRVKQGNVDFDDIAMAGSWVCAITSNDVVYCWGDAAYSDLGANVADATTPQKIKRNGKPLKYRALSASNETMCGKVPDKGLGHGDVECWGSKADGQLGNGTKAPSGTETPQRVKCVRP